MVKKLILTDDDIKNFTDWIKDNKHPNFNTVMGKNRFEDIKANFTYISEKLYYKNQRWDCPVLSRPTSRDVGRDKGRFK